MSSRHDRHSPVEITRVTRGGRTITYCLKVIQQPERARACGSGAKSSADRRPVDPPPVVELRIYEGEGQGKDREDITFGYEANFFLFASLELSRPMAQSRNLPTVAQPPPVLTGMPVSGMAYLDRPTEAGYFIFPDLSVRHEGKYKLAFNLYEQTKKDQDLDAEPSPQSQQNAPNGPHSADSSFDFRMEVKSSTFSVWSAKKFPGLKESTALSRTVAEQGCRVRIRRDVRMRRRGESSKGPDYEDADEYARGRAGDAEREDRSRSNSLSGSESPNGPNGQHYLQSQPGNNLSFIPGANSQFAAPPQHFAQQQSAGPHHQPIQQQPPHQQQIQQQPPHRYPQQPLQQLYSQPPPPPPQSNYSHDRHPQSAYPANPPRDNFEPEHRRASVPYPPSRDFPVLDPSLGRPQQQQYAPRPYNAPPQNPVNIAPIKLNTPIEPKYVNPALSTSQPIAPDYSSSPRDRSGYNSYPAPPPEPARAGAKRSFDTVFMASTQPLHNGMRPVANGEAAQAEEDEETEYTVDSLRMEYRRADGGTMFRGLPNKGYQQT